jgi:hypothetical protein
MTHAQAYSGIITRLEAPSRSHLREVVETKQVPPKLRWHGKLGVLVWVLLLSPALAFEMFAFADGPAGAPTLSQLVKGARRAGGIAGTVILALLLAVAYVTLNLHWVAELF